MNKFEIPAKITYIKIHSSYLESNILSLPKKRNSYYYYLSMK